MREMTKLREKVISNMEGEKQYKNPSVALILHSLTVPSLFLPYQSAFLVHSDLSWV